MLDHEWRPRKYSLELWKTLAQIVLHTQNKNQSWLNNQSQWKWDRSIIKLIGMLRLRMYGWVERAKKWHLPVRHNKEWFFMFFHFWMCSPLSWRRQLKFHTVLHLKCNKYKKSKKPYQVYEKQYGSYSPMSFRCLKFISYRIDLGSFLLDWCILIIDPTILTYSGVCGNLSIYRHNVLVVTIMNRNWSLPHQKESKPVC